MTDKLEALFEIQRQLQREYRVRTGVDYVARHVEGFAVKEMVLAGIVELVEILGETNWKTWRGLKEGKPDWERYCDELVDLMKFVINLALIGGLDAAELHRRFVEKTTVNVDRMSAEFR